MKNKNIFIAVSGMLTLCAGTASIAFGQVPPPPTLLETLDRGLWQLRGIGGAPTSAAVSQLCLGDPNRLVQIQHGDAACERLVLKSSPTSVTVSYSCRGQGQGITTIRKEGPRLIQIQSQGIRNNSPFSFQVEGRRTSGC